MAAYVLCVCDEEIPDDGLKGSKHVGLFIKRVLSDFSVT